MKLQKMSTEKNSHKFIRAIRSSCTLGPEKEHGLESKSKKIVSDFTEIS